MKNGQLPQVQLRDLTIDDVEDRFKWSLDKEVTKHLNMPDSIHRLAKKKQLDGLRCVSIGPTDMNKKQSLQKTVNI